MSFKPQINSFVVLFMSWVSLLYSFVFTNLHESQQTLIFVDVQDSSKALFGSFYGSNAVHSKVQDSNSNGLVHNIETTTEKFTWGYQTVPTLYSVYQKVDNLFILLTFSFSSFCSRFVFRNALSYVGWLDFFNKHCVRTNHDKRRVIEATWSLIVCFVWKPDAVSTIKRMNRARADYYCLLLCCFNCFWMILLTLLFFLMLAPGFCFVVAPSAFERKPRSVIIFSRFLWSLSAFVGNGLTVTTYSLFIFTDFIFQGWSNAMD